MRMAITIMLLDSQTNPINRVWRWTATLWCHCWVYQANGCYIVVTNLAKMYVVTIWVYSAVSVVFGCVCVCLDLTATSPTRLLRRLPGQKPTGVKASQLCNGELLFDPHTSMLTTWMWYVVLRLHSLDNSTSRPYCDQLCLITSLECYRSTDVPGASVWRFAFTAHYVPSYSLDVEYVYCPY